MAALDAGTESGLLELQQHWIKLLDHAREDLKKLDSRVQDTSA